MNARKGFDIDLVDGKAREDAFARVLLGGRELVEHKRDFWCVDSNNVAIEFETSTLPSGEGDKYPSGLAKCEAYWVAIEIRHERWVVITLADVKQLARAAYKQGRHKWIGDNKRFHNALVPVWWFVEDEAQAMAA